MPWTESPLFYETLHNSEFSDEQRALAIQYHEEGYIILDLDIDPASIISDISKSLREGTVKTQEAGYHYSEGARVFEAWRWSQPVLDLARHPKVLETLKFLYGREAQPFQTINFELGSNQPLHSDTIHFHTNPGLWMVGVWVALEDMDDFNGTLAYVPKSHKLPVYDFQTLNLPPAKYGEQFESYALYEDFIRRLVRFSGLQARKFYAKPGQALVWAANILHGGSTIRDPNRTRWSQATHYYFPGCKNYYSPMFSDASAGVYAEKDMSNKDILNHVI